jgi:threonylcarbamoyladenosine tRNA methylthiotransferase MtaB
MMRGLSVKKRRSFMKASWEAREQFFLKAKIKGYIHGFTENYVKVTRGIRLVNTFEINLTTIDTDGSVRMEF